MKLLFFHYFNYKYIVKTKKQYFLLYLQPFMAFYINLLLKWFNNKYLKCAKYLYKNI